LANVFKLSTSQIERKNAEGVSFSYSTNDLEFVFYLFSFQVYPSNQIRSQKGELNS